MATRREPPSFDLLEDELDLAPSPALRERVLASLDPANRFEGYIERVMRLFDLPDATRVFVGHDYAPGGRKVAWETTIGAEKAGNVHVTKGRQEFVKFRTTRDATLEPPRLMLPSVQVNVRAGALPDPAPNGRRYLKLPVGLFG